MSSQSTQDDESNLSAYNARTLTDIPEILLMFNHLIDVEEYKRLKNIIRMFDLNLQVVLAQEKKPLMEDFLNLKYLYDTSFQKVTDSIGNILSHTLDLIETTQLDKDLTREKKGKVFKDLNEFLKLIGVITIKMIAALTEFAALLIKMLETVKEKDPTNFIPDLIIHDINADITNYLEAEGKTSLLLNLKRVASSVLIPSFLYST
jgi:hypothetical protein